MSIPSHLRPVGEVAWSAIKDYAVPATFVMLLVKMQAELHPWAFRSGIVILIGYVVWRVVVSQRARAAAQRRLTEYETLIRLMTFPADTVDQVFSWHTVRLAYFLPFPDAHFSAQNEGVNSSHENQDRTLRTIAGDSPVDFQSLGFTAFYDLGQGEKPAAVDATMREQGRKFLVSIGFLGDVVRPGQDVKIRYSCRWPNTVARSQDYLVFTLQQFGQPVGRLLISVAFPELATSYRCVWIHNGVESPVRLQAPKDVTHDGRDWKQLCADITQPSGVYLLHWQRTPTSTGVGATGPRPLDASEY
jgi:hypothetical protein